MTFQHTAFVSSRTRDRDIARLPLAQSAGSPVRRVLSDIRAGDVAVVAILGAMLTAGVLL